MTRGLGLLGALLAGWAVACDSGGDELRLVGTVERTLLEIVAPVSETLLEVPVERGQAVAAGDLLVQLDPTLAEAEVAGARATRAGARTAVSVARHDLERVRRLHRGEVVSERELDHATLAFEEAQARLEEAEARLRAARKREADLRLVAPAAGVVDQIPFDPGERVPAGAVVMVLLETSAPWVRVWVPEPSLARVRPGTPAEVRVDGVPEALDGRVLDVAREPEFTPHFALTERDRVHLVYETRVRILGADVELRPGVPAEVVLHPERTAVAEGP